MAEFVLDPAVACKWFLPTGQEPLIVESRLLLDRIAKGSDIAHVPGLFYYEFGAWAHHEAHRFNIDPERAYEAVRALPLREHVLDRELATAAHLSVTRHSLDFYTAVYVALSERLLCPFLTPSEDLLARLQGQTRLATLPAFT
jgi:predicted nucleic acid-binding protein